MAALAYVLPPLSGLIAFGISRRPRTRFHGLQSVIFGAAWPAAIYLASLGGATATRIAFAAGALLWLLLLIATALGRDPGLPGARTLRRWAEVTPWA